jgi:aryl-alcohol dehydrogenase
MKTLAAIARKPHEDFSIEDIEVGEIRPDEVLVEVVGVGLCHTDIISRDQNIPVPLPAVLGHEGSGIVVQVGSEVSEVSVGDQVVMTFLACGHCKPCSNDEPSYCAGFPELNFRGTRTDGSSALSANGEMIHGNYFGQSSFARHAVAHRSNVIKVDAGTSLKYLGPLGCGIQTGAGSIMRSFACEKASSVVVIGGGSVGLSAIMGAVIQQCASIVLVEPMENRRHLALELGATHAIDPKSENMVEQLQNLLPKGADYILDNTGIPAVIEQALTCLAPHGVLGILGSQTAESKISIDLTSMILRGQRIIGILEGDSQPQEFIPQLAALYRAGKFPLDKLITFYPLSKINEALADQHRGDCIKAVLIPDS